MLLIPCLVQSHKSNFPRSDHIKAGAVDGSLEGSVPVLTRAGDVLVMSECTQHSGLPKTTEGLRSNLYFNYTTKVLGCHPFATL
jgi:hypothetical protein